MLTDLDDHAARYLGQHPGLAGVVVLLAALTALAVVRGIVEPPLAWLWYRFVSGFGVCPTHVGEFELCLLLARDGTLAIVRSTGEISTGGERLPEVYDQQIAELHHLEWIAPDHARHDVVAMHLTETGQRALDLCRYAPTDRGRALYDWLTSQRRRADEIARPAQDALESVGA